MLTFRKIGHKTRVIRIITGIEAQKMLFLIVILRIKLANKIEEITSRQRERISDKTEVNIPPAIKAMNITRAQSTRGIIVICKKKNKESFFLNQI